MADKRISQLIERTDIANNDVLPIVASGATTTNKVTISTIQDWMQENLDVGVTSVGLSMPSAFTVSNSPVTTSGNISVTGAGSVSQYIRGDGSLADFPSSTGGGSSVSYYLNGSVNQGTIGGIAYRELSKSPILGAGTDFTINADGYIASFITDAGDPNLLLIPAGNWNFETYLQASSGGGSPTFYIELYKVSGSTATLIASNSGSPELIAFGTNINPYFSALAVPETTLLLTDRLAIRYYVTHSGRTITLHTENNTLCQIITTFTTGLTALNGLTAQVQNFATGSSGTDFNISSSGTTHTFNIPSASATARGLVTTGTQTIAGSKTFADTLNTTPDAIINGVHIGKGGASLTTNTRIGTAALGVNTTGTANTAVGFGSLQSNTTGPSNTAVGLYSLLNNTTGASNTGIGSSSLISNTLGNQNTAVGDASLYANTTGSQNTAVGRGALNTNTTASDNTAIGFFSLYSNTTGTSSTSVGSRALFNNTTGNNNTANGYYALFSNTTGSNNSAFGHSTLNATTTGGNNSAFGLHALQNNTTGGNNTAVGFAAGSVTNGGLNNATSSSSVYLGHDTRSGASGNSNEIVIGAGGRGNGSNTVVIGNASITDNYFTGNIRGGAFIKSSGTSSQFLKADGSVDSNAYLPLIGGTLSGSLGGTSASFSGDIQTSTRLIASNPGGSIILTANLASTTNRIESTNLPLEIFTSGSELKLRAGAGNAQVTLASTGAVTLTGALNGTIASFSAGINAIGQEQAFSWQRTSGTASDVYSINADSGSAYLRNNTTSNVLMTWLEGGNVGIGTASPSVKLQVEIDSASEVDVARFRTVNGADNQFLDISVDNTNNFVAYDASGSVGGDHIFRSGGSERMRITAGGNVGIGTGTNTPTRRLDVRASVAGTVVEVTNERNSSSGDYAFVTVLGSNAINTNSYHYIAGTNGGADRLYIYGNGNVVNVNNSYGALSDIKLKENIEDASPKLQDLLKVKVRNYNLIGEETKQIGVIAQELEEVFPAMIDESEDLEEVEIPQLDEEGNELLNEEGKVVTIKEKQPTGTFTKSVKYSVFVPIMIKAIQEQQEQIQELKTEIDSLKNQIK